MIVKICNDDKFNFSYPDFFDYCLQKLKALHELKRINNKVEYNTFYSVRNLVGYKY